MLHPTEAALLAAIETRFDIRRFEARDLINDPATAPAVKACLDALGCKVVSAVWTGRVLRRMHRSGAPLARTCGRWHVVYRDGIDPRRAAAQLIAGLHEHPTTRAAALAVLGASAADHTAPAP